MTSTTTDVHTVTLKRDTLLTTSEGWFSDTDLLCFSGSVKFDKGTEFTVVSDMLDMWLVQDETGRTFSCHKRRLS